MSEQRVLIFMPTYEEGGIIQAFPESVESFYDLDVPEGWKADWVIGLDNPYGREGRHKNTLHQYQQIQRRVLDEGYDALVTFEDDRGAYDQKDAEGFIRLNALRLRTLAARKRNS